MSVEIWGNPDPVIESFAASLRTYAANHPSAAVHIYRESPVAVRVRIVDSDFRGKSRSERHKAVWPILYDLGEEELDELGMLLLIAPEERDGSVVNREFEMGQNSKDYGKTL